MALTKKAKVFYACAIVIVLVSVAFLVLNALLFPDFLVHPVLNAVALTAFAFSIASYIVAASLKAPVYFMLGGILLGFVALYLLIGFFPEYWWIAIIATIALWLITAFTSYLVAGNKTEEIALNKKPEYETYDKRMEKKYADAEKKDSAELPEIKSFKE